MRQPLSTLLDPQPRPAVRMTARKNGGAYHPGRLCNHATSPALTVADRPDAVAMAFHGMYRMRGGLTAGGRLVTL